MNKEMATKLIKAWAKENEVTLPPSLKWAYHRDKFHTFVIENGDDITFTIEENTDYYRVGLMPYYIVKISAEAPIVGLRIDEVDDFEGYVDTLYDEIADTGYDQWSTDIPFGDGIRPSDEIIIEEALDDLMTSTGITDEQIIFWYTKEKFIPAFLDQTSKHMAKQVMTGIDEIYLEDVVQFWIMEMENDESMDTLIDEVREYYNGGE